MICFFEDKLFLKLYQNHVVKSKFKSVNFKNMKLQTNSQHKKKTDLRKTKLFHIIEQLNHEYNVNIATESDHRPQHKSS